MIEQDNNDVKRVLLNDSNKHLVLPVFIVSYGIAKCIKGNNKGKYYMPLFND